MKIYFECSKYFNLDETQKIKTIGPRSLLNYKRFHRWKSLKANPRSKEYSIHCGSTWRGESKIITDPILERMYMAQIHRSLIWWGSSSRLTLLRHHEFRIAYRRKHALHLFTTPNRRWTGILVIKSS